MRTALEAGATEIPSLSLWVSVNGAVRFAHTVGNARRLPTERLALPDEIYDLASVTKALVGSTVAATLVAEGRLGLDDVVDGAPSGATVLHLLQHASGWPAWAPLYAGLEGSPGAATREELIRRAWAVPPVAAAGAGHAYSDIGFIALTDLLERVGRDRLDVLFARRVAEPLGVDLRFGWPGAAATEDCPLRGRVIEGEVHDPNAWWMAGVAAHAGLFGCARQVGHLCDRLREAARVGAGWGGILARLWSSRGPGSHVGGWDTPSRGGYTSTGSWFPDDAVGHLGYTGTSAWIVPSRRAVVVLLTNRIHPRDDRTAIRRIRPLVHDAVAVALGWSDEGRPLGLGSP